MVFATTVIERAALETGETGVTDQRSDHGSSTSEWPGEDRNEGNPGFVGDVISDRTAIVKTARLVRS